MGMWIGRGDTLGLRTYLTLSSMLIIGGQVLLICFIDLALTPSFATMFPKRRHLIHSLRNQNHMLGWENQKWHTMNTEISDVAINNAKGYIEMLLMNIFLVLITQLQTLYTFPVPLPIACAWPNKFLLGNKDYSHKMIQLLIPRSPPPSKK